LLDKVKPELLDFVQGFNVGNAEKEYLSWDALRFAHSLDWLSQIDVGSNPRVLELGGQGLFTKIAKEYFPTWRLEATISDLRDPLPFDDNSFDCVISMEVLEHITDPNPGHQFNFVGMTDLMKETNRILRERRCMFLTTPNFASIWAIQRALLHQPPLLFDGHVRELTFSELGQIVQTAHLEVVRHETLSVWHDWDFTPIIDFIQKNNYQLSNRGDDQFLIARKA
jgi:SAM-dependent methyltransferase